MLNFIKYHLEIFHKKKEEDEGACYFNYCDEKSIISIILLNVTLIFPLIDVSELRKKNDDRNHLPASHIIIPPNLGSFFTSLYISPRADGLAYPPPAFGAAGTPMYIFGPFVFEEYSNHFFNDPMNRPVK